MTAERRDFHESEIRQETLPAAPGSDAWPDRQQARCADGAAAKKKRRPTGVAGAKVGDWMMRMHERWAEFGGCTSSGNLAGTRAGRHPSQRKTAQRSGGRIRHAGTCGAERPEDRQTEARREMAVARCRPDEGRGAGDSYFSGTIIRDKSAFIFERSPT